VKICHVKSSERPRDALLVNSCCFTRCGCYKGFKL